MGLIVTQRPPLWSPSKLPVVYKMTRKDRTYNTADNDGSGKQRVTINGGDYRTEYPVGHRVYVSLVGRCLTLLPPLSLVVTLFL